MSNSDKTANESTSLTPETTTSGTTTSAAMHLDRVYEILWLLGSLRGGARAAGNEREAKRLGEQATSLRWLIADRS